MALISMSMVFPAPCIAWGSITGIPGSSISPKFSGIASRFSRKPRCIVTRRRISTQWTNSQERQQLTSEVFYSSPWKGGWWQRSDACEYMLEADMAVLDLSSKYREQIPYNRYQAARDTIERFQKEPPFAYTISREQHDAPTAALLMEKLMLNGIEIHRSTKPDAWVIQMNQPYAGLVKELFEPSVSGAQPAPLRRHRLDVADANGCRSPSRDVTVDESISRFAADRQEHGWPFRTIQSLGESRSFKAINEILAAKGTVSFFGR